MVRYFQDYMSSQTTLLVTIPDQAPGLYQCVAASFNDVAPISRKIAEHCGSSDLRVYEFFGMSEVSSLQTCSMQGKWKIVTCRITIDVAETKVAPVTDELIFIARNIMMGYLKDEQQTKKETIDEDGRLHSGDCGKIDNDAFIMITGRIEELIVGTGSKTAAG